MPTCPECGEENPPRARFCLACGAALGGGGAESRRLVSVLFCDLAGSTAIGERQDPEQLRRVLSRYAEEARAVIERHGGTVEKFIGDAVMAVFGIPVVHEDDALRAARAAIDLRSALDRLNAELSRAVGITIETRTGINSGEVFAGDPSRGEGFVTGDAVNVAKRLEENAGVGEILIGDATYRLARDALVAELLPPLSVKGKAAPLTVYRLAAVTPGALPRARRLDAPMVGRADELELLRRAFVEVVRDRTCRLFTILGAAGVGKSRLVSEVVRAIEDEAEILSGTCPPYGEGITFWPVIEVVKQATGVTDLDSAESARAKIAAAVADDEEAELVAERLAPVIGLSGDPAGAHDIFWALRRLLESRARRRPVVVVFDDVNWGEPTFLDLVEHLPDWSQGAPILLLCMARPELLDVRPGWGAAKARASTALLEPLADDETRALIDNLVGEVDDTVHRRIAAAAEGNPLFVEELAAMLLEEGMAATAVPATINVLLAARLDRLEPNERRVLECAAVEGAEFHAGAVSALAGRPAGDALFALVRKDLVRSHRAVFAGEDGFRFRHILLRDAAYDSLPKSRRAELHARYAEWLEDIANERPLEYEELLGYHLEQAFRCRSEIARVDDAAQALARRAADHLASAGGRALERRDAPAAASLLARAAALAEDAEVQLVLGQAYAERGSIDEAATAFETARVLATRDRDARLAALARMESAFAAFSGSGGPIDVLLRLAEDAIAECEAHDDDSGLALAWERVAQARFIECRSAEMGQAIERGLAHAQSAGDELRRQDLLVHLTASLAFGPTHVDEALARCRRALEQMTGVHRIDALIKIALLEAMAGRFEAGRELLVGVERTLSDYGLRLWLAGLKSYRGQIAMLEGDFAGAEREIRGSVSQLQSLGEQAVLSTVAADLGLALYRLDRDDEAEAAAVQSERAASLDDVVSQVLWRSVRARVLARRGATEEAGRLAREAVSRAGTTDWINLQAQAHSALADVLRAGGSAQQAGRARAEALRLYTAKGNAAAARLLRELDAERAAL